MLSSFFLKHRKECFHLHAVSLRVFGDWKKPARLEKGKQTFFCCVEMHKYWFMLWRWDFEESDVSKRGFVAKQIVNSDKFPIFMLRRLPAISTDMDLLTLDKQFHFFSSLRNYMFRLMNVYCIVLCFNLQGNGEVDEGSPRDESSYLDCD